MADSALGLRDRRRLEDIKTFTLKMSISKFGAEGIAPVTRFTRAIGIGDVKLSELHGA